MYNKSWYIIFMIYLKTVEMYSFVSITNTFHLIIAPRRITFVYEYNGRGANFVCLGYNYTRVWSVYEYKITRRLFSHTAASRFRTFADCRWNTVKNERKKIWETQGLNFYVIISNHILTYVTVDKGTYSYFYLRF